MSPHFIEGKWFRITVINDRKHWPIDTKLQFTKYQHRLPDSKYYQFQLFRPSSSDFFPPQKPSKSSIENTTVLRATSFRELLHSLWCKLGVKISPAIITLGNCPALARKYTSSHTAVPKPSHTPGSSHLLLSVTTMDLDMGIWFRVTRTTQHSLEQTLYKTGICIQNKLCLHRLCFIFPLDKYWSMRTHWRYTAVQ